MVKRYFIQIVIMASVLAAPLSVLAQTSSINAFSPYSMYGVGELQTPGSLPSRSMGGVGVAMRSTMNVNMLNPAAYSTTPRKGILFSFGVEDANFYNSQQRYLDSGAKSSLAKTSYNTFNFHDISLQVPIIKGLGVGFSLSPYSSVGYRIKNTDFSEPVLGAIGNVAYVFEGEGDITEVKLGLGWNFLKRFSIGVAAQYYWGNIDRYYKTLVYNNFTGEGTINSIIGTDNYTISHFGFQVGAQVDILSDDKRALTWGATYDYGANLSHSLTSSVEMSSTGSTVVDNGKVDPLQLKLPQQFTTGLYFQNSRWAAGFDYTYQHWRGGNPPAQTDGMYVDYANTNTYKAGVEFTPNRVDVRRFMNRCSYRFGMRYGNYYQTFQGQTLHQYAVTVGIGIPLKILGRSSVDVGFEYGGRSPTSSVMVGSKRMGLVNQQYFKISLGVSLFGDDYWFSRPKFD